MFFNNNYKYLLGFSKSINPKDDYESLTHDGYIRARTRIQDNGYSGDTFLNYMRCVLMNLYKSQYRSNRNKTIVDINDEDYYQTIEDVLNLKDQQEQLEAEQQNINTYLNTMIYQYIEEHYDQREIFVFKTYYLLKHKHLNYKSLAITTGYSITAVSNIIKKMKKDLRANLKRYITDGQPIETSGTTVNN